MSTFQFKNKTLNWFILITLLMGVQMVFEVLFISPLKDESAQLQSDLTHLRGISNPSHTQAGSQVARLESFSNTLVRLPTKDDRILKLHQLALEQGVTLSKISYRSENMGGSLQKDELQMEIKGSYPAIRGYIRSLQIEDIALSIDSLEFRQTNSLGKVLTNAKIVLYSSVS